MSKDAVLCTELRMSNEPNAAPDNLLMLLERKILFKEDPLARALSHLSKQSSVRVFVIGVSVYSLFVMVAGFAISIAYQSANVNFMSIQDIHELSLTIISSFFVFPAIWTLYSWQAKGIIKTLEALSKNGVIKTAKGQSDLNKFVATEFVARWNNRHNFYFAAAITLVALFAAAIPTTLSPSNPLISLNVNRTLMWWGLNPYYFWLIWLPVHFLNFYMVIWMAVRQIHIVSGLSKIYSTYPVVPKPFHPDRCNGFAPVGNYSMKSTLIAIVIGFWLAVVIVQPVFFNQPINIKGEVIALMFLYVVAVPALVILPVWSTHQVMTRTKSETLEAVAIQIREILQSRQPDTQSQFEQIQGIQQRYELIDREYRTWPFRKVTLGGFSVTALIPPVVTTVIPYLTKIYFKQP
jgi:hypothetical protein